jgi:hypothetical protein
VTPGCSRNFSLANFSTSAIRQYWEGLIWEKAHAVSSAAWISTVKATDKSVLNDDRRQLAARSAAQE